MSKTGKENGKTIGNDHLKPLSEREVQVLQLVTMGKSNTEIAKELSISVHTIKAHVCSILSKMSVKDRVQAAVKAIREGVIP